MNKETADQLARAAALETVKEFEKSQKKNRKVRVFQNAKKLMENYNRICQSVQEGVPELFDVDDGEELEALPAEDIYINSIIKSKLRSIVMIAHIDKCLGLLEEEMIRKDWPERYDAFKHFYLDDMTYEQMAEEY
ncbi:helix-turn-helix domain-containing protein [Lacrimispora indolis]|uniref:helix-turn-helix domain-containing protein n=1 Tax=Lacrimispora indolis TaxID=69825 RepID=UPI00041D4FB7|nr:helix-turn-helix domain-containing protein [[Clostridium] methoxybenzovorans]